MSPTPVSTRLPDDDKTKEQPLSGLQDLNTHNAIIKESRAKNANIRELVRKGVEEELRRANRALKVLSRCKEAMIRTDDETILLNDICRILVNVGGYRMAWIGFIENDALKSVRPVARAGYDEGYVDNLKIALEDPVRGNGPTGISLRTGKPYGSRNVGSDIEMRPWRKEALKRGYVSTLNLPVVYENQVIGALVIYSDNAEAFDEEERGLLFELAQTLAYGITAIRDRARRTKAEEELQRANSELERRVDERTEELTKVNDALRKSEAELARAQQISHVGSWTWDLVTDEIAWSDQSYRNYGLAPGEVKPTYGLFLSFIVPEDRERVDKTVREAIEAGSKYSVIYRIIRTDGTPRVLLSENEVIMDGSGKVIGMYGTNQDITERKLAEEELNAAKQQAELYLDLMGHDINNMNQVGLSYLEVALETLKEEGRIDLEDVELLERPLQSIRDSARLIDNVRKLRSTKSKEFQLQPIDLKEILLDIKEQFAKANGRHIIVNYTPVEGHVLATGLVKDVFINIVGNAVKHSDADKPLEINIIQTRIYGTDESYHKVIIDDNGPGIPDGLKSRIFNRFERGNTKASGKGLGLYLVKTLVHDFNGKIWVEDRVQGDHTKGARFVVMLPAIEK